MNTALTITVVLLAWSVSGAVAFLLMARHAHRHPYWLLVGILLGPLALVVFKERCSLDVEAVPAPSTDDRPSVVVGVDGSPESLAAVAEGLRASALTDRLLVLCTVVDFDTAADPSRRGLGAAREQLVRLSRGCPPDDVRIEVVAGRPGPAIAAVARQHGAELVVVGRRGTGLSTLLLGSTARQLLELSPAPLLFAGPLSGAARGDGDRVPA